MLFFSALFFSVFLPLISFAQADSIFFKPDVLNTDNLLKPVNLASLEVVSASRNSKKLEDC